MDKLSAAKRVFDIEIDALSKTRDSLDSVFENILDMIVTCKGKVIITGMGKPGHVATKIAATFASLGTPAFFLHPGEAMHGDLGMISADDIVIAISYSGESDEIINILPNIKLIGAKIVAITGNKNSTLSSFADIVQVLPTFQEACTLGLAPTSSTTVELCYGDALAVTASEIYGFKDVDFGKYHPAGALGKKLVLKVEDLMVTGENNSVVNIAATMMDTVIELSKKGLGMVSIVSAEGDLMGIITDGDLRRQLEKKADIYNLSVSNVMTKKPHTIESKKMAVEALTILKEMNVSCMPVVSDGKPIGTIRLQDIIGAGIIG